MSSQTDIKDVAGGVRRLQGVEIEKAYLGVPIAPGVYEFEGFKPGRMRARLIRGHDDVVVGPIDVINDRVVRNPKIRILVSKNSANEYVVLGPDPDYAQEQAGENAGILIGVGPHSHEPGFGLEDPVSQRRIKIGLVHATTGLLVYVEPFYFEHQSTNYYFPGEALDLTTLRPVTGWNWALIGHDPSDNSIFGIQGTEYATRAELTTADLLSIVQGEGNTRLVGVQLKFDAPDVEDESLFQDQRIFLGGGSGGDSMAATLGAIVTYDGHVVIYNGDVVWYAGA